MEIKTCPYCTEFYFDFNRHKESYHSNFAKQGISQSLGKVN